MFGHLTTDNFKKGAFSYQLRLNLMLTWHPAKQINDNLHFSSKIRRSRPSRNLKFTLFFREWL